ncbi:hypothetical protein V8F06_000707 [Rhypophila decipiens]
MAVALFWPLLMRRLLLCILANPFRVSCSPQVSNCTHTPESLSGPKLHNLGPGRYPEILSPCTDNRTRYGFTSISSLDHDLKILPHSHSTYTTAINLFLLSSAQTAPGFSSPHLESIPYQSVPGEADVASRVDLQGSLDGSQITSILTSDLDYSPAACYQNPISVIHANRLFCTVHKLPYSRRRLHRRKYLWSYPGRASTSPLDGVLGNAVTGRSRPPEIMDKAVNLHRETNPKDSSYWNGRMKRSLRTCAGTREVESSLSIRSLQDTTKPNDNIMIKDWWHRMPWEMPPTTGTSCYAMSDRRHWGAVSGDKPERYWIGWIPPLSTTQAPKYHGAISPGRDEALAPLGYWGLLFRHLDIGMNPNLRGSCICSLTPNTNVVKDKISVTLQFFSGLHPATLLVFRVGPLRSASQSKLNGDDEMWISPGGLHGTGTTPSKRAKTDLNPPSRTDTS